MLRCGMWVFSHKGTYLDLSLSSLSINWQTAWCASDVDASLQAVVRVASMLDSVLFQLILHHLWRPATIFVSLGQNGDSTLEGPALSCPNSLGPVVPGLASILGLTLSASTPPQEPFLAGWPLFIKQPSFSVRTLCELKLMVVYVTRETGHNASLQPLLHIIHKSKKWNTESNLPDQLQKGPGVILGEAFPNARERLIDVLMHVANH